MKEIGIIMSGDHPKLILDGKKTQTRRVIKPQPPDLFSHPEVKGDIVTWSEFNAGDFPMWAGHSKCPYGQVGSRLWVRETVRINDFGDYKGVVAYKTSTNPDFPFPDLKWTPSIFMPRWASRITLEITEVRVERVQEIPYYEVTKEGIQGYTSSYGHYGDVAKSARRLVADFRGLWDSLNAKRGYGWEVNPWVWVISFRRLNGKT